MSEKNQDNIQEDWVAYTHLIQAVRQRFNLPDIIFSEEDRKMFEKAHNDHSTKFKQNQVI